MQVSHIIKTFLLLFVWVVAIESAVNKTLTSNATANFAQSVETIFICGYEKEETQAKAVINAGKYDHVCALLKRAPCVFSTNATPSARRNAGKKC